MKLVGKISIPIVLLVIVILMLYLLSLPWNPYNSQKKTSAFLHAIQTQSFEEAEELFNGMSDKNSWISEMKKLHKEEDFRLVSFARVKAEYDDGSFSTGHANLNFEVEGKPLNVEAILTFDYGGRPKQVCAIHPPGSKLIPELLKWNELVCGGSF